MTCRNVPAMTWRTMAFLGAVLALVACAGSGPSEGNTPEAIARRDCAYEVDREMQMRGYPRRPSPETPYARYRRALQDMCLRDKGYAPD